MRINRNNKNSKIYEVNLEQGHPTVDTAMKYLEHGLARAKSYGYPVIKLIHGYGSSGSGGKIRTAVQRELSRHKSAGKIREFSQQARISHRLIRQRSALLPRTPILPATTIIPGRIRGLPLF